MKIIPNTKGKYAVERDGTIWRVAGTLNWKGQQPPHILSDCDNGNGYRQVNLLGKICYTHRLVAEAYLDNPSGFKYVGHKDHDKSNNNESNLYWTDAKTNTMDGVLAERINYSGRYTNGYVQHTDAVVRDCYLALLAGSTLQVVADTYGVNRTTLASWRDKKVRCDVTDSLDKQKE